MKAKDSSPERYQSGENVSARQVFRLGVGAAMLPRLAKILDLSLDEMLMGQPAPYRPGRRGPPSHLAQQLDAIARLPKPEQRAVSTLLTAVLAQHATG